MKPRTLHTDTELNSRKHSSSFLPYLGSYYGAQPLLPPNPFHLHPLLGNGFPQPCDPLREPVEGYLQYQ
jgi:hypothetical protein